MTMKPLTTGLVSAFALTVSLSTPASAAVNIAGSVTGISYRDTDPGLVITASPIVFPGFTLTNAGDYQDFDVLTIGTTEGTVNTNFPFPGGEDITPYPISVTFTFTDPAGASGLPVSGSTGGFYTLNPFSSCGIFAGGCGYVDWGAPSVFNFGNGGQFSVELFDTTFGTPGNSNVTARFTLLNNSAVPEPATWAMMLIGFGVVGTAMRRRQRSSVSYSFA